MFVQILLKYNIMSQTIKYGKQMRDIALCPRFGVFGSKSLIRTDLSKILHQWKYLMHYNHYFNQKHISILMLSQQISHMWD